jgi:hypothetical protein
LRDKDLRNAVVCESLRDGAGGIDDALTHDEADQITGISGEWIDPAYDDAGNMAAGPVPGDAAARQHYRYDGQGRHIAKVVCTLDGEDVTCERAVTKAAPSGDCLRANRYSRFCCGAGGLLSHAFGVYR